MMYDIPDWKYKIRQPDGLADGYLISLSTRMALKAAQDMGATWEEIPGTRIFKVTYNGITRHFHYQVPPQTTELGFNSCLDKAVTRALLTEAGVSLPAGFNITKQDPETYWTKVFQSLHAPLVVKPTHGNQGRSVFMNITTEADFTAAVKDAFSFSPEPDAGVIVEETLVGTEYRILATRDKVIGIINRIPANVVGDGQKTLQLLIDEKNADPRRSEYLEDALVKIKIDQHVTRHLTEQGLTPASVPAAGQRIFLRANSNISTGGDSIDVTDQAHPSVMEIALKTMQAIPGISLAGIDFMTRDITQPQSAETYGIVEVNGSPGFCIHDLPYEGKNRQAAREFVYLLFPELKNANAALT